MRAAWRICVLGLQWSRLTTQYRKPLLAHQRELRPVFLRDRIGRGNSELLEILVLAALQDAEIQMRPSGQARAADVKRHASPLKVAS